ncbi:MAG TPA: hypothetical protein VNE17_02670 [Nitrolancea sp.]|nr:hypothetical protein [Nitrolancea sp.]
MSKRLSSRRPHFSLAKIVEQLKEATWKLSLLNPGDQSLTRVMRATPFVI